MTWLRTGRVIAAWCLWFAAADIAPVARAQTKPPVDNPVAALSLQQLSATRERPLFSPSRRTPRPPVISMVPPTPVQAPAPPPHIELHGTIIGADDALAIVFSTATNQTVRVHVGDEIGGWKVAQIDDRKLVLSLAERTAVFTIFPDKPADKTSAAPASGKTSQRR